MPKPSLTQAAFQRLTRLDPFPQPAVVPMRHPLVLLHGFGLFASFRRGGHLNEEALRLRSHGVRAYAPNVAPYTTIRERAEQWAGRLEHVLDECRTDALCLVTHSMGGLDARYLISHMGWHRHVRALVTIAAPHRGTPVARFTLDQPERLRTWMAELADWMGVQVLDDATTDFAAAVAQLTRSYVCETFNPRTPDHPDVRYWSYAGRAGKGTDVSINPFLRLQNYRIYEQEGVNDGYVSVESARWGTYLGAVDADHGRQIGLSMGLGETPEIDAFYRSIAQMLYDEGF